MISDILTYFIHSGVVVFSLLFLLWSLSVAVKDASLVDVFWGFGFLTVAAVCLYLVPVKTPYLMLLAAMPIIWGLRLSLYLGRRNIGIFGGHGGEDVRYIAMRERAEKKGMSEMAWRLRSLFTIYFGQGVLIMIVSAPVWTAMASATTPSLGILAFIGAALWLTGFLFEAIGDAQLAAFKKKHADYNGDYASKPVLNSGLWKYTRHPNYFGNACMWWGIWLVACQAPLGWATIFAPIIMNLLLVKVSGKDLLERSLKKRPAYREYMERTSGFFPLPPKSK